jgi:hypothetical protein
VRAWAAPRVVPPAGVMTSTGAVMTSTGAVMTSTGAVMTRSVALATKNGPFMCQWPPRRGEGGRGWLVDPAHRGTRTPARSRAGSSRSTVRSSLLDGTHGPGKPT